MKIDKADQTFLSSFSKSNEWTIFKDRILIPLLEDVASVKSEFKFDEDYTAGEKYAGREIASKFGIGLIEYVEKFDSPVLQTRNEKDSME